MSSAYNVVVIGAGPAGYVAAIRCAQLGLKTVCVDEWLNHKGEPSLGGTCLNVGCIPSKALLESSHLYQQADTSFSQHGISLSSLAVDVGTMQDRKSQVVQDLTQGIKALFKANGVDLIHGRAKITTENIIEILQEQANSFIIGISNKVEVENNVII